MTVLPVVLGVVRYPVVDELVSGEFEMKSPLKLRGPSHYSDGSSSEAQQLSPRWAPLRSSQTPTSRPSSTQSTLILSIGPSRAVRLCVSSTRRRWSCGLPCCAVLRSITTRFLPNPSFLISRTLSSFFPCPQFP